ILAAGPGGIVIYSLIKSNWLRVLPHCYLLRELLSLAARFQSLPRPFYLHRFLRGKLLGTSHPYHSACRTNQVYPFRPAASRVLRVAFSPRDFRPERCP